MFAFLDNLFGPPSHSAERAENRARLGVETLETRETPSLSVGQRFAYRGLEGRGYDDKVVFMLTPAKSRSISTYEAWGYDNDGLEIPVHLEPGTGKYAGKHSFFQIDEGKYTYIFGAGAANWQDLEAHFTQRLGGSVAFGEVKTGKETAAALAALADGSTGVLRCEPKGADTLGYLVNVIKVNGKIYLLDGRLGRVTTLNLTRSFRFIDTTV